jgi:hypothetical protein
MERGIEREQMNSNTETSEIFKKGFFMGRLIWVRGMAEEQLLPAARGMLVSCNINPKEMWLLTPIQFVSLLSSGFDRAMLMNFEVMVVHGFDTLSASLSKRFFSALAEFRALQMGLGVRLVLVSTKKTIPRLSRLNDFSPIVLDVQSPESDPGDLNAQVHSLIECASAICGVSIRRITEKAALFLEQSVAGGFGEEILSILVDGIQRSNGRVLSFSDLMPDFAHSGAEEECRASICNQYGF